MSFNYQSEHEKYRQSFNDSQYIAMDVMVDSDQTEVMFYDWKWRDDTRALHTLRYVCIFCESIGTGVEIDRNVTMLKINDFTGIINDLIYQFNIPSQTV